MEIKRYDLTAFEIDENGEEYQDQCGIDTVFAVSEDDARECVIESFGEERIRIYTLTYAGTATPAQEKGIRLSHAFGMAIFSRSAERAALGYAE